MSSAVSHGWEHVVVTGGAGFVGSHLCGALLDSGARVTCVDDLSTGRPENIAPLLDRPGFLLVQADVAEELPVRQPPDLVLHFASPASSADCRRLPLHTLQAGSLGTRNALELARSAGARFVLASASEVYGDPQKNPQDERYPGNVDPAGPLGVRAEAKRFAEALTTAYAESHGTDTCIVRLFHTYGPRMRGDDGRAVPTFVRRTLAGEPLTVTGDGRQTRSLCYADDIVAGVLAAAAHGLRGPVNIGCPDEICMLDLARLVVELTGSGSEIRFVERPPGDPAGRRPDITLARDKLGWEPRVGLEEGLRRTIAWFRAEADGAVLA
ncbi:GDP-mannose 4,6-dehydratase [Streptomyces thermospinosisporus]|uniref:GDP-mannose 4,6-dehydratase n=1 Tax=Streptomyces thermospinosisporus TaxID=161482 RepID=A0ABN1YSN9_9ACTN